MNRQRFMAVVLAGLILAFLGTTVHAGWWESLTDAKPVKLSEVIKDPYAWKGKEIVFECTFHKVSTFFNPYYTRFIPREYVNFSAWPLDKRLWVKEDYASSHPFLFLEKDHDQYKELMELTKFTRLKVVGYVQSTFKGSPWIEVRHIEVLGRSINKDALKMIILGDRAAARKDWESAMAYYDKAAAMSLPDEVLASISMKRATTLHRMGQNEQARAALGPALAFDPKDEEAVALLDELNKLAPAPAAKPETLETTEEVAGAPVDPKRYPGEEPKAMPAPEEPPVVETPAEPEKPAVVEAPPAPEKPAVVEAPPAPEKPAVVEALPAPEKPVPPVAEKPVKKPAEAEAPEAPEKPAEAETPVKKRDLPKKRLSGPM